jgi:hypothetical protein
LAARWQVPSHGVFIEDEELIDLASLPFARQVTVATGLEPLTKDHIKDHFRAFAERLRRELAAAAARHGVECSFEVVRGPLAWDAVCGEHDFVVAGAASRPVSEHFRIASRCWSLTAIIARPFLLAKRQWGTGGSVFALLRRRGPQSAQMLEIAAQIAGICRTTLTVAGPPDLADTDDFAAWVSGLLEGQSLSLRTVRRDRTGRPAATDHRARLPATDTRSEPGRGSARGVARIRRAAGLRCSRRALSPKRSPYQRGVPQKCGILVPHSSVL